MLRIEHILYPTDFSPCAAQALLHGVYFAEAYEAELHMLHVTELPTARQRHLPFPDAAELLSRAEEAASSELARLGGGRRSGHLRTREVVRHGWRVAPVVLEYADEQPIDLIVLGTHGRRPLHPPLLGSVAEEVVRLARCLVLTLRSEGEERTLGPIEAILVPVDLSDPALHGLEVARHLAARYGARLEVLHVLDERPRGPLQAAPGASSGLERRAEEALEAAWREGRGPPVPHALHVVRGHPVERILARAEALEHGVIVQASHGLTGWRRVLLGSVAGEVVRQAGCPVFTAKPYGRSPLPDG